MLIEIAIRIEGIADVVNELEGLADFACNGSDLKDYKGIVSQISYSFWDVERSEAIGFLERERERERARQWEKRKKEKEKRKKSF